MINGQILTSMDTGADKEAMTFMDTRYLSLNINFSSSMDLYSSLLNVNFLFSRIVYLCVCSII